MGATKILLLADCRCGGTVLRQTLDQHPQLRIDGELLHPQAPHPHDWKSWLSLVWGSRDGWHLQRYQIPQHSEAWGILAATDGLRLIDLRRDDTVEQYASWRLAMATQHWHRERQGAMPRLVWSQDDCDAVIYEWQRSRAFTDQVFARVPKLRITFEQIAADFGGVLYRCQQFIGIEPKPLTPAMERMRPVDYGTVFKGWPR